MDIKERFQESQREYEKLSKKDKKIHDLKVDVWILERDLSECKKSLKIRDRIILIAVSIFVLFPAFGHKFINIIGN